MMNARSLLFACCLLTASLLPHALAEDEASPGLMGRLGGLGNMLNREAASKFVEDYVEKPAGEVAERARQELADKSLDELLDEYIMRPAKGAVEYYKGQPTERFINDFFGENEDETGEISPPEQGDKEQKAAPMDEPEVHHVKDVEEAKAYVAEQTRRCVPVMAVQMERMPRNLGKKLIQHAFARGHAGCASCWGGRKGDPLYLRFDYTDDARIKATHAGVLGKGALNEREQRAYEKARLVVKQAKARHSNDYDVAVALHDHLVLNCRYDMKKLKVNGAATVMLLDGRGVCNAYMRAYSILLEIAGIENEYICGGNHGWNLVKLEDEWTHIDVTWDDPVPDQRGRLDHTWFGMTDRQIRKSHRWSRSLYPRKATCKELYYPKR